MKYSRQRRKTFVEIVNFINGRDIPRLILSAAVSGASDGSHFADDDSPYGRAPASIGIGAALLGLFLAASSVSVVLGLWTIAKVTCILIGKIQRPKYYPQERSRRARLARDRRRVRDRFTLSNCPKPKELLAQYEKAKSGAREALRFGSMLCDLEAFCDNSLLRNVNGEIVGRNPGMKGWIRDNCPELLPHYKNAMRYKGLAEKFRQVSGAADPLPAAALLAEDAGEALKPLCGDRSRKITVRMKKRNGPRDGKTSSAAYALEAEELEAAWRTARKILAECEGDARPRCGKNNKERGEVARLERIIEERLCAMPEGALLMARWRVGVTVIGNRGKESA